MECPHCGKRIEVKLEKDGPPDPMTEEQYMEELEKTLAKAEELQAIFNGTA